MRLIHFDIHAGISGDMTVAALTHLGASLEPLTDALRAMGLTKVTSGNRTGSTLGHFRLPVPCEGCRT